MWGAPCCVSPPSPTPSPTQAEGRGESQRPGAFLPSLLVGLGAGMPSEARKDGKKRRKNKTGGAPCCRIHPLHTPASPQAEGRGESPQPGDFLPALLLGLGAGMPREARKDGKKRRKNKTGGACSAPT